MSCDTIRFRLVQDQISKDIKIEFYRPYGDNKWMKIDVTPEITPKELKYLTEYLLSLFKRS